ncbi:MAG: choice-of-anchor J domain-containing protein [Bacteroidetes bacterium]|nr:choice-of-anchor J domain-containing protein [Bacteroidota bacterium]
MRKLFTLLIALMLWAGSSWAQVSAYSFAQSSGTYTAITGTASTASGDDGTQSSLPIGFTFTYNGVSHTTFSITTNGCITLTNAAPGSWWTNTLAAAPATNCIAPLWDDNNLSGGTIIYSTTGTAGSMVCTVQWTNCHIGGSGSSSSPTASFQIKLFETTNIVEIIYGGTSAALTSTSASIGITGATGNYLSVTPGIPATVSSSVPNNSISSATNFPSGTIYAFTPPVAGTPGLPTTPSPANAALLIPIDGSLTWTFGANTATYDLMFGPSGSMTQVVTGATAAVTGSYTYAGIAYGSTYQWQVIEHNGGLSTTGPIWSFSTACASVSAITQLFDGVTAPALPNCWLKYTSPSWTSQTVTTYITLPSSAPNCVQLYSSGATLIAEAPMLISPEISNLSAGTNQIRFAAKGASTNLSVIVGTMSDPTNAATFTAYQTVTGLNTSTYTDCIVNFADYTGTDKYIAFRHPLTTTYSNIYLDNVYWEPIPACPMPTLLTATGITATSALLGWNAPTGTSFDIEYGLTGFTQTGTPTVSGVGNPYAIGSLLSNTSYSFYVRQVCAVGVTSTWSSAGTFTTLCSASPVPTTMQTFEGAAFPPGCWTRNSGLLAAPSTVVPYAGGWIQDDWRNVATPVDKAARINIYGTLCNYWLMTPQIDLGAGSATLRLEFDLSLNAYGYSTIPYLTGTDDKFAVVISTDGGTTWTSANTLRLWDNAGSAFVYNNINYTTGEHVILSLAGYSGIVKIGFYGESTLTNADNDLMIDNLLVQEPPACPQPLTLTAAPAGFQAILGWTEGGIATSWDIEWGATPYTFTGTPTITGVTHNPYTLTGLTPVTGYTYYVRANCAASNSEWSGPKAFTTTVACPAPTGLGATGLSLDGAKLGWTETGGATTWDIELRTTGSTFTGTPTDAGVSSNPYNVTGLISATSYTYHVRSVCGGASGNSEWSSPYTFSTTCGVLPLPYCQSFPAAAFPACWTEKFSGTITSSHWAMNNTNLAGGTAYEARANYAPSQGATQADNDRFVSPGLNTTGLTSIHLSFRQMLDDYDAGLTDVWVKVQSSADGITWTDEWVHDAGIGASITAEVKELDITNNLGGTTYIAFTLAGYTYDINNWYIDDVCVSSPLAHDAGTVSIDNVPSTSLIGSTVTPKATVKNYGLNAETFDVTMTGTDGYTSTVSSVSLAAGASVQVTFTNWTPAAGSITLQACTQLVGDLDASNNCKSKTVVVSNVAWSSGTAFPSGTYMGTGVGYTDNSVSPPVGYLFSFGGNTTSTLGTECYKYNVNTATWTTIASLPAKRIVMASTIVGNYAYVIGGSDGVAYFNTVYRYDILLDTWTTMTSTLPKTLAWGKAVSYGSNYIYLAGGVDAYTAGNIVPDVYLYDITLDTWTPATFMPGGKFGGAFARTGNKLAYVAGADAVGISNTVYVGTIDGSTPATIVWATAKSAYPGTTGQPSNEVIEDMAGTTPIHVKPSANKVNYPAGAMYRFDGAPWGTDGIIVAAGSPSAAWTPAVPNPTYYFNPTTDTWTAKPDVPVAVLGAATGSVDLNNGGIHTWKLIVAAGYTGTASSTATQILTEIMSVSAPLAVTGTVTNVTGCFGNTNGSVVTNVTGGVTPYNYLWSNAAITASLTGIAAGTYMVTVTDGASTAVTGTWTVTEPTQVVLSAVVTAANCPAIHDGAIDLSVTGGTPVYTYLWSNGGDAQDLSALASGVYSVTVTDANGCIKTGSWSVGLTNAVCANTSVTGTVSTTVCYNASTTITVAGGVTTFTVTAPDGNATFIAGYSILFEPGTVVQSGAYMHGYISNTYCLNPSAPITASTTGQDEPQVNLAHAYFTLYPNPTSGNFTLVQKGDKTYGTVKVEVYSMNGTKVLTESMVGEKSHEFRFTNIPVGLYFVKIVADDYVETIKLIRSR